MRFEQYARRRDSQVILESTGTSKGDIRAASKAMKDWVTSTYEMLEAIQKIPEAFGELGGAVQTQNSLGERTLADELTMEVQRVKYVLQEVGLEDIASRIVQHSARIQSASEQLM